MNARAVFRNINNPADRNNNNGFRVVSELRPTPLVPLPRESAQVDSESSPLIREQRLSGLLVEYACPAATKR